MPWPEPDSHAGGFLPHLVMEGNESVSILGLVIVLFHARWAPTSYKWSYNPYKWPYNWVTGVITPISGLITILITGRGPTLWLIDFNYKNISTWQFVCKETILVVQKSMVHMEWTY